MKGRRCHGSGTEESAVQHGAGGGAVVVSGGIFHMYAAIPVCGLCVRAEPPLRPGAAQGLHGVRHLRGGAGAEPDGLLFRGDSRQRGLCAADGQGLFGGGQAPGSKAAGSPGQMPGGTFQGLGCRGGGLGGAVGGAGEEPGGAGGDPGGDRAGGKPACGCPAALSEGHRG